MFIGNKWKMADTMVCPAITLYIKQQKHGQLNNAQCE